MGRTVIGVMGPGPTAREWDCSTAFELGKLIANEGWTTLSGGMAVGVMDAVSRGARENGGLTIGIGPTADSGGMSSAVDIPIVTGMGSGRNVINVLSSDVVIACGMGPGTASEIALAIKAGKPVILLNDADWATAFFARLGGKLVQTASTPEEAIKKARAYLA